MRVCMCVGGCECVLQHKMERERVALHECSIKRESESNINLSICDAQSPNHLECDRSQHSKKPRNVERDILNFLFQHQWISSKKK